MKYETEMQEEFVKILKLIHNNLYNALHRYTNKQDIKKDLVKLMENVYDEMFILQKDININIEASNENSKLL